MFLLLTNYKFFLEAFLMKRFFSLFLLLFTLTNPVASAEMISGFNTYSWGTAQAVIDESVQLAPIDNNNDKLVVTYYVGVKDFIVDENGTPMVAYNYGFEEEKLVSGSIIFSDKAEYDRTVKEIVEALPPESHIAKSEGSYKNISHFLFEDTRIMIQDWDNESNFAEIIFLDENASK